MAGSITTHTVRDQEKLINRVKRLRGQLNGVEKQLESEAGCEAVLQTLAACRGALSGLMAEILEDHIRYHVLSPRTRPDSDEAVAAEQLIDVLRSYLK